MGGGWRDGRRFGKLRRQDGRWLGWRRLRYVGRQMPAASLAAAACACSEPCGGCSVPCLAACAAPCLPTPLTRRVVRSVSVASRSQCASSTVLSQLQPAAHSTCAWPIPRQLRRYSRFTCTTRPRRAQRNRDTWRHPHIAALYRTATTRLSPGLRRHPHCRQHPTCTASRVRPPSAVSISSVATAPGSRAVRPHLRERGPEQRGSSGAKAGAKRQFRELGRSKQAVHGGGGAYLWRAAAGDHSSPEPACNGCQAAAAPALCRPAVLPPPCSLLRHKSGLLGRPGLVLEA